MFYLRCLYYSAQTLLELIPHNNCATVHPLLCASVLVIWHDHPPPSPIILNHTDSSDLRLAYELLQLYGVPSFNKVKDRKTDRQEGTSVICFKGAGPAIIFTNAKLLNSLFMATQSMKEHSCARIPVERRSGHFKCSFSLYKLYYQKCNLQ